jgi:peroxiredoxin
MDLTDGVLIVTIFISLIFILFLPRDNIKRRRGEADLRHQLAVSTGSLVGPPEARIGDIVPAFDAVSPNGARKRIAYDSASTYLFFIMSPSCDVCLNEISTWNSIASRVRDPKLTVLGVLTDSQPVSIPPANFDLIFISDASVRRAYRVVAVPSVMIVSSNGRIQWVHYGKLAASEIAELLSLIDKPLAH